MATAAALIPNFQYKIIEGDLADEIVTIIDNNPFPDTDRVRRRKVTISFSDGSTGYILPRQLADRPCGVVTNASTKPQPAPLPSVPTMAPAAEVIEAPTFEPVDTETAVAIAEGAITDPMDPRLDHLRPNVRKVKGRIGGLGGYV